MERIFHSRKLLASRAMAKLCKEANGPRAVAVPLGGLSGFDRPEGPLYDPEARKIMAEVFRKMLGPETSLHISPRHINDPEFGELLIDIVQSWIKK